MVSSLAPLRHIFSRSAGWHCFRRPASRRATAGALVLLGLALFAGADGKHEFRPDGEGFIRNWLILAPIPSGENVSGADAVKKEYLLHEGSLRPKSGEKTKIGDLELIWKPLDSASYAINFNTFLGQQTEDATAYAVTYIVAAEKMSNLVLKIGSDDQSRLYLNGKLLIENDHRRSLDKDQNSTEEVTLEKGANAIVFKVVNEKADWSGAVRLTDKSNNPVVNLTVRLEP